MSQAFTDIEKKTVAVTDTPPVYAGFWIRAVAFIIDSVIISIPATLLSIPLFGYGFFHLMPYIDEFNRTQTVSPEMAAAMSLFGFIILLVQIFSLLLFWLYYAILESSAKQASWGKQLLELHVTDEYGQRISFGRATGRTFAKIISYVILYIGFMMAGWTKEKCALHDFIAGTRVVKNNK